MFSIYIKLKVIYEMYVIRFDLLKVNRVEPF